MSNKKPNWQTLRYIPGTRCIIPNGVNRSHLIAIVPTGCLYGYDFDENTWNKYDFVHEIPFTVFTAAIDINNKTLYYFHGKDQMIEIQIAEKKQNKWKNTKHSMDIGSHSQSIMIEEECHLIGGSDNNKHLKYNVKLNEFDVIHTFNDFAEGFWMHRIVSFNNNIFVFGGSNRKTHKTLDTIYHYNINENMWDKLTVKMPKPLYLFGCTTAINNEYILIFGGADDRNSRDNYCDEIYIFSLLTQSFTESKIRCPRKSLFQAITINDETYAEMAVFGYVREQWVLSQIADYYFPPHDVLKVVCCYFVTEYIHLFDVNFGHHWRINSFDIVS